MRTILFTLATLAAASAFNAGAAQARDYPFCLKNSPGPGDCKYDSYEQCYVASRGINGYCQPNYGPRSSGANYDPYYGPSYGPSPRARRYYGPQY